MTKLKRRSWAGRLVVACSVILTLIWALQTVSASSSNPHNIVKITKPAKHAGVVNISITGPTPPGSKSTHVDLGEIDLNDISVKTYAIRNAINALGDPSPYKATATRSSPNGPVDTITVTVRSTGAPAWNVKLGGNKTQEGHGFRKEPNTSATGCVRWTGSIGGGTVSVGTEEYVSTLDTGTYASVADLRSAVANDLNAHGVSASIVGDDLLVLVEEGDWFYESCEDPSIEVGLSGFTE